MATQAGPASVTASLAHVLGRLELVEARVRAAVARRRAGDPETDERLVLIEVSERPVLTRSLRVPDRVAAHLLGSDIPDASVAALAYVCDDAMPEQAATLVRWMRHESPSTVSPSSSEGGQGGGPKLAYIRERPGAFGAALA